MNINLNNYAIIATSTNVVVTKNISTRAEARKTKKQIQTSLGLKERDLKIVQLQAVKTVR